MSAWPPVRLTARPPNRLFHLVLESHDGRALVPIPKRSTSPRGDVYIAVADSLKVLDLKRPIREADFVRRTANFAFGPNSEVARPFDWLTTPTRRVAPWSPSDLWYQDPQ